MCVCEKERECVLKTTYASLLTVLLLPGNLVLESRTTKNIILNSLAPSVVIFREHYTYLPMIISIRLIKIPDKINT